MMVKDDIIRKIQKLLALAGNNPNEAERIAAMEMAHDMLAKHNISMTDLHDHQGPKVYVCEVLKTDPWIRSLMHAACTLYYTSWFASKIADGPYYPVFVGQECNIMATVEIVQWLVRIIREESNRLFRDTRRRRSFRTGASDMINYRAQLIRKREIELARADRTSGKNELMVVVRNNLEKQNEDTMKQLDILPARKGRAQEIDENAAIKGIEFGESVQLNKQLTGQETKKLEVK